MYTQFRPTTVVLLAWYMIVVFIVTRVGAVDYVRWAVGTMNNRCWQEITNRTPTASH